MAKYKMFTIRTVEKIQDAIGFIRFRHSARSARKAVENRAKLTTRLINPASTKIQTFTLAVITGRKKARKEKRQKQYRLARSAQFFSLCSRNSFPIHKRTRIRKKNCVRVKEALLK